MESQMEQARIRIELDEMEEMLEIRREERVQQTLALQQFLHQVETAKAERDQRRQEKALEEWADRLSQRVRQLRCQTDLYADRIKSLKSA